MRSGRLAVLVMVVFAAALTACKGGAGGSGGVAPPQVPAAFNADAAKGADIVIDAKGGGVAVRSGEATAGIYVPAGAAKAGATWRVTPLTEAPAGVKKPLCPGVYVDTVGGEPTGQCVIGFSIPGTAAANATIVNISHDGKTTEIVPTSRLVYGGRTILTAYVDGFSPYTTSEEDQAAIDQAAVDRAKAKGQQVDWTIKASGAETQTNEGWKFNYEFDLFASGGGVSQGGTYNGHSQLLLTGKYDGPTSPYIKSFGEVKGSGYDKALTFTMTDAPMTRTLTGEPPGQAVVAGFGTMNLTGLSQLNMGATGIQGEKAQYNSGDVEGSGGLPFMIKVTTFEDVLVEVPNVGVFPGKILRTTK